MTDPEELVIIDALGGLDAMTVEAKLTIPNFRRMTISYDSWGISVWVIYIETTFYEGVSGNGNTPRAAFDEAIENAQRKFR